MYIQISLALHNLFTVRGADIIETQEAILHYCAANAFRTSRFSLPCLNARAAQGPTGPTRSEIKDHGGQASLIVLHHILATTVLCTSFRTIYCRQHVLEFSTPLSTAVLFVHASHVVKYTHSVSTAGGLLSWSVFLIFRWYVHVYVPLHVEFKRAYRGRLESHEIYKPLDAHR